MGSGMGLYLIPLSFWCCVGGRTGRRINANQFEWTGAGFVSVNKEGDWWGDTDIDQDEEAARLLEQRISAYGKGLALRPGMTFSADIRLGTRTLWEWLLDPLYSLRGRLQWQG